MICFMFVLTGWSPVLLDGDRLVHAGGGSRGWIWEVVGVGSPGWKVKVCVCSFGGGFFPAAPTWQGIDVRCRKWGSDAVCVCVRGVTEKTCHFYPHVPESGCQEVTTNPPPPSSFLLLHCLEKENLSSIEIAKPISAYFCFERKDKHLLKNWVTKELWV